MRLGEKIKRLLDERNMRSSELADAINVPRSTINSLINRNSTKIDVEILFKICDELKITTDELLGYTPHARILISDFEEKLILAYREANFITQSNIDLLLGVDEDTESQAKETG